MTAQLTDFQRRATATAVFKMFDGKFFSIIDLDNIARTLGRRTFMSGPDYDALHSLHCADWAMMGPDLARMVREKCLELLGLPPTIVDVLAPEPSIHTEQREPETKRVNLAFWR